MAFRTLKSCFACTCILTSLLACQFTTTNIKNPTFSRDAKSLTNEIDSVILTQAINVNGEEINTNGRSKSVLTVSLINPQNMQADAVIQNRILGRVASIIKYALKDTSEYMYYNVYFVNRVTKNHMTNSTSTGNTFRSEEIKPE